MAYNKHWIEKLERAYKEPAITLIPRLLTFYGKIEPLAEEAQVSVVTVTRWCEANHIERKVIFRVVENGGTS